MQNSEYNKLIEKHEKELEELKESWARVNARIQNVQSRNEKYMNKKFTSKKEKEFYSKANSALDSTRKLFLENLKHI